MNNTQFKRLMELCKIAKIYTAKQLMHFKNISGSAANYELIYKLEEYCDLVVEQRFAL